MKLAKALATLVFSALLLLGGERGAGASGEDHRKNTAPSPAVTVTQGAEQPDADLGGNLNASGVIGRAGSAEHYLTADTFVYGSTFIEEGQTFYLRGHSLTIYGDFTICGTLYLDGGRLIVSRDPKGAADGNLIVEGGLLVMRNDADAVQVEKAFIADGRDETGCLTAGKIRVGGDFLQLDSHSPYSYNASGTHVTEFAGAGKLVQFYNPASSSVRNLSLAAGTSFTDGDKDITVLLSYRDAGGNPVFLRKTYSTTGGAFLSLSQALSADYAIAVPNLYYSGSQGGRKLTVNGTLIVPTGCAQSFTGDVAATDVFVAGTLNASASGRTVSASGLISVTGTLNESAGTVSAKDFEVYGDCNLTGGVLRISGSFRQIETPGSPASREAFQAGEGSAVTFTGADCSCAFDNPGLSYFNEVTLAQGASFAPGAAVSVKRDLAADGSVTAPLVCLAGNLNGHKLAVNGNLRILSGFPLTVGGGTLDVSGDIAVDGALTMADADDLVKAGGDFLARSDAATYERGIIETGGMFRQCGEAGGGSAGSFAGGAGLAVRLKAAKPVWGAVFDDPENSWFAALEIAENPATDISPESVLSLRGNLSADLTIPGTSLLYVSGSLNGHRLRAHDAMIPAGRTLEIGTGRLDASGFLDVKGVLDMRDASCAVAVGEAFTAEGLDSWGHLSQGFLALQGNFEQKDDGGSVRSFCPGEGFKTLLVGGAGQTASFESPADPGEPIDAGTQGSWFGALYNCNGGASFATAYYAVSECASALGLQNLSVSAGSGPLELSPAFDGTALSFEVLLPEGETALGLASARHGSNQIVKTFVDGAPLPGDPLDGNVEVSIDPAKTTVVKLQAASAAGVPTDGAGEPFATDYTLTVQPVNTKLASVAFAHAAFNAGVAFDPADSSTVYAVTVPIAQDSFTLSPALANPNASLKFLCGGMESTGAGFTRSIGPGDTVEVDVTVTAYHNETAASPATRTYRFSVRRQTLIDGISLSSGILSPVFDDRTGAYSVYVPASAYSVVVSPDAGDGCASVRINGTAQVAVDLRPEAGGSAQAEIALSDATGEFTGIYTVTVRRAALLAGISVAADTGSGPASAVLQPAYSDAVHSYVATVPANSVSVAVSGMKEPGCTGLLVGGQADSFSPDIAPGDSLDVALVASAGALPEQRATYTVSVRKPLLIGLGLSAGTPEAPFDPDPAAVTHITLPYAQPSVTLTPAANDAGTGAVLLTYLEADAGDAEIAGPSANVVSLAQGQTRRIKIRASCAATAKEYSVEIYRELSDNADLYALGATAGWPSPGFSAGTAEYALLLPENVSSVTLAPICADVHSVYRIDSLPDNKPATYAAPATGQIDATITVTALRGNTKTYRVAIRRASMLASFAASPVYAKYASLSPGGTDRLTFSYTTSMPVSVKIEIKRGSRWYTLLTRNESSPGGKTFVWDGKVSGRYLGTGTYSVRITPYWAGKAGTARTMRVKILPRPAVYITRLSPFTFKANGTSRQILTFRWTRLSDVRVDIVTYRYAFVRTLYSAANQAPRTATLTWDGRDSAGNLLPAGTYRVKITCGGKTVYKTFRIKR